MKDKTLYRTHLIEQTEKVSVVTKALYESALSACDGIDMVQFDGLRKLYITGCGDSYCAAVIMKPAFEQLAGLETDACRCVDFSRHYCTEELKKDAAHTLLIGISCSGNVSRVTECMKRASALGIRSLAVTFNPGSPVGTAADTVLAPVFPKEIIQLRGGPGCLSYNSSLMGLTAFAVRLALRYGKLTQEEADRIGEAMFEYFDLSQKAMDDFDDQAFEIAEKWAGLRAYDFIGDYGDYATAFFGSAKVLEGIGGKTTYDDSEDWCHINFFLHDPKTIGRVVIANTDTPSYGRLKETLRTIDAIGSPCLVVTDGEKSEFPDGFEVAGFPKPMYFWMHAAFEHIAFDKVIGYIAGLLDADRFRREQECFSNELVKDTHRIRSSEIIVRA